MFLSIYTLFDCTNKVAHIDMRIFFIIKISFLKKYIDQTVQIMFDGPYVLDFYFFQGKLLM